MRVFLDTNVLVSAFSARGLCNELYEYILNEHELFTGEVIIHELRRVLKDRIGVSPTDIKIIENLLREHEVIPTPSEPHPLVIKDPDDKWVLASAIAGRADVLVTGDKDLLEVASQAPIPIMTPRNFWNMARGESGT
ncbi:MAG: putative toxin-antitoxin system toxin component, PIN family [Deltaproteobacteria bacterium]|nr:putative toxin-antitoxin system toxin component, PIN family [Deltaproteobacteria bacterium]